VSFTGRLDDDLRLLGLADWLAALLPLVEARLADDAHGDMPRWRRAVAGLPAVPEAPARLDGPVVRAAGDGPSAADRERIREGLLELAPWRKGPFELGGVRIDSEWRSDLKWERMLAAGAEWSGRRVLDVGCGNGYYACRMLGAGAACVVGVDPTLLFVMQAEAIRHFLPPLPWHVLPLRAEELPPGTGAFDTVVSAGVLYHQRSPIEHLRQLRGQLRPGGELLLETLILPGDEPFARTPPGRYARMRNVWLLPTLAELDTWLSRTGYTGIVHGSPCRTTPAEQRPTDWMRFESLSAALDPGDPARTIEGWPAPTRVVVRARVPGPA